MEIIINIFLYGVFIIRYIYWVKMGHFWQFGMQLIYGESDMGLFVNYIKMKGVICY